MHLPYPGTRSQALPAMWFVTSAPLAVAIAWLLARAFGPSEIPSGPTLFSMVADPASGDDLALKSLAVVTIFTTITWILFLAGVWKGTYRWLTWAMPLVWALAGMKVGTLIGSIGADSYDEAASRNWPFLIVVLVFVVGSGLTQVLSQRPHPTTSGRPLPRSSLTLSESERAVFVGYATSRGRLVVGALLAVLGCVLMKGSALFFLVVVIGLLSANSSRIRVVIDHFGVAVRIRWIPWAAKWTPIDEIASGRVICHGPAWEQFGNGEPEKDMIRIRRGEALELVFHDGKTASISLDQAEQAVDVLNALIVRHRTSKDPTLASQ